MDTFPSYVSNILLQWLLIFAIMLHQGMCSLRVQCNEKDHHVLLNFKQTIFDPSAILSTWSDERDCCEWIGVQCDNATGRVTKLSLPCFVNPHGFACEEKKLHCLTGELRLSLLQLEFLNYLDLSNNDFQAIIQNDYADITNCNNLSMVKSPHACENFSRLHYLDLSHNEDLHIDNFQWLSHVSSLKYVDFSGIDLQGKIDWLQLATLLPSLTKLFLDSCQLRNINPSLQYANFTSLEVIKLSDNAISSQFLPDWLFNLSHVTVVDLRSNSFQGQLPKRLLNLRKIEQLYLSENKFSGPIPDWLGQLEHLQVLDVSNNLFSSSIPSTLGNLSSLNILDVHSNHLNGSLLESLGLLSNLEDLSIGDNYFMGVVSERNFVKLSNLKSLEIGSPGLIFDFDSLWAPPFQLEHIYLEHMMGPKLPAWLYTQRSLKGLYIEYSKFSFESQDKFWDFAAQLTSLVLVGNTIDGDMSNVLLNSTIINLMSNKLKGSLPQLSPNVVVFKIGNNSLQGSISPLLCQRMNGRSQLKLMDMSNNLLSGGLTDCWMNWKMLVIVRLNNNNLTGTIPLSMSFLSNLMSLRLNKNNLFGEIPSSLKNCQNLHILDVAKNKFSGNIPDWITHNTKVLQFRSNQFSGNIPPQICQLASLVILDIADNKISGSIPICLYNMTAMASNHASLNLASFCFRTTTATYIYGDDVVLLSKGQELTYEGNGKLMRAIDLSNNSMSGTMPSEIFSLVELISLNLSHNQFVGNIPKEIGNLKQLESLDLASNRLSGEIPQSMAKLSFLASLNLSFNNFTGEIPLGTQLQGFDALSYIGNLELCGAPLPKNCSNKEDIKPIEENDNHEDEFLSSLYIGLGVGFAIAFWGVCGAIFFNRTFRHTYFRFLNHSKTNFMSWWSSR